MEKFLKRRVDVLSWDEAKALGPFYCAEGTSARHLDLVCVSSALGICLIQPARADQPREVNRVCLTWKAVKYILKEPFMNQMSAVFKGSNAFNEARPIEIPSTATLAISLTFENERYVAIREGPMSAAKGAKDMPRTVPGGYIGLPVASFLGLLLHLPRALWQKIPEEKRAKIPEPIDHRCKY